MATNNSVNSGPIQYNVQVGGANGTLSNVAPSATNGIPVVSAGSSANPTFGTAVVAGGGTGIVAAGAAYAPICAGTTTTGAFQTASTGISNSGYVLTSTGASSLPTWQVNGSSTTIDITGDTGPTLTGNDFVFSGGSTGLSFAGSTGPDTLTLSFAGITANGGTVSLATDATTSTINVGTGAGVKTSTFGSTNSTSATTMQSGSGALNVTATGGALTINSGTGALSVSSDASATTVNIATGGAAKTLTVGSTNTTSSTAIKSGSGNVAINSGLTIDSTGRNTNAAQPAFQAWATAVTDVTGDGTGYNIVFDNVVFNRGSNFDGTSTFTAPVTGLYMLNCSLFMANITAAHTDVSLAIVTSNAIYRSCQINPGVVAVNVAINGNMGLSFSVLADMDASDTALVNVNVSGSTKTVDVGGIDSSDRRCWFSGYLVA